MSSTNTTVIPSEDPYNPAQSDKPFIAAIVSILVIVVLSMIYVLLKRRQEAERYARQQAAAEMDESIITLSTARLAPDPMTQIFFNCSTASLETIGRPPPVYTVKDQHLEFENDPPPPPFSVNIPIASASTSSSPVMSLSQRNQNELESVRSEECPPVVVDVTPEPLDAQTIQHSNG